MLWLLRRFYWWEWVSLALVLLVILPRPGYNNFVTALYEGRAQYYEDNLASLKARSKELEEKILNQEIALAARRASLELIDWNDRVQRALACGTQDAE